MLLHTSEENYLKAIFVLQKKYSVVRAIDVAQYLQFSKPSVSNALKKLQSNGYLEKDGANHLSLTPKGQAYAERIYEKYSYFHQALLAAGVNPAVAEQEACSMEHVLSDVSFQKLKKQYPKWCF